MIKLDENYRIEFDANNFILKYEEEKTVLKKGKEESVTSTDHWYYHRLDLALTKYVNQSIKVSKTAEELLYAIKQINEVVSTIKIK